MKNFVERGETITVVSPGVLSGQLFQVGSFIGVAAYDAPAGTEAEMTLEGVFSLPKDNAAIAAGAKVYFDASPAPGVATATLTGNVLIGAAVAAAGASDAEVRVRLNGIAV